MTGPKKSAAIVIGASGGLGSAVCRQWQQDNDIDQVFAVSRRSPDELATRHAADNTTGNLTNGIQYMQCDYSESSIASVCEQVSTQMKMLNLSMEYMKRMKRSGSVAVNKRVQNLFATVHITVYK